VAKMWLKINKYVKSSVNIFVLKFELNITSLFVWNEGVSKNGGFSTQKSQIIIQLNEKNLIPFRWLFWRSIMDDPHSIETMWWFL
jgi:hypothetical protein